METFGPNSAYINELYFEYLKNPAAFDEEWRQFFASYNPAAEEELVNGVLSVPAVTRQTSASAEASGASDESQFGPRFPQPGSNGDHTPEHRAETRESGVNGQAPKQAEETPAAPKQQPEPPKAAPAPASVPAKPAEKAPTQLPEGARQLAGVPLRIAQNMAQSLTVPTATSFREVPVKLLEENRTLINGYLKASDQGKLSFTHIIGWAIVKSLMEYPSLNNGFQEIDGKAFLIERPDVNLGLAIDLERPDGGRSLVVPSIKRASRMDFRMFYDTYESLVKKARQGKLGPDDFMGTTVTLTNPGTIGTIASVPRLMAGQGTIIATGGINYPAAYQAMDAETLSELGISKVMQITSTYDHRIIQGAESGMFLSRMQDLLMGENDFYEEIFRSLRIPYRPLHWQRDTGQGLFGGTDRSTAIRKQGSIQTIINNYQVRGHLQAHLNPLGFELAYHPELDPANFGLTIWDFDRTFMTEGLAGTEKANFRTILSILRDTYTQRIGVEFRHIQNSEQRHWLQDRMETTRNQPSLTPEQKRRVLRLLSDAEGFEKFLQTKYTGNKRFSLEGAESAIPMIDELVHRGGGAGVRRILLGMAHRGRLNVLANIMGKSPQKIFSEFEDIIDPNSVQGSGDVKYHLGQKGTVTTADGRQVIIDMAPNPSHLEAVDPVIEGMARAYQDRISVEKRYEEIVPLLVHGDAAFAGQGVVAEVFNMSQLQGYHTGGTIHLVINNQIGFTASPHDTKSMLYCTDMGKSVQAPIFHVNGDDPEACIHVMRLAFEYRQMFKCDVVIDLFCYRRHGHNEGDEPSYTNPMLYHKIKSHPSTREVYTDRLLRNGTLTQHDVDAIDAEFKEKLEAMLAATRAMVPAPLPADVLADQRINPVDMWDNPQTGVPAFVLDHVVQTLSTIPDNVNVHPKLAALVERRPKQVEEGKIDWAFAEQMAFGTLLLDGHTVRLSGQDSQRGTFSQRHATLSDQKTGERYIPLCHLAETQAPFYVYDSPLSEYAVLGFEYGYSVADSTALTMWEAQFGDFVNGAQIVIDQFISSGEDKWGQTSNVVMLLPHGFEGQGPEHSSARLERFLTLCAEDNMQVTAPTTAAQYFHLLRRQVKQNVCKPLIVMTPKSLLRDPMVSSKLDDFTSGTFQTVLPESDNLKPTGVRRLLLCSGKMYYDLMKSRRQFDQKDVAIIRLEQLYPFPAKEVRRQLDLYGHVSDIVWVQEEPKNMGAWPSVAHWVREVLRDTQKLRYLGRPASGSPASGSSKLHKMEQEEIIRRALGITLEEAHKGEQKMPKPAEPTE
jgi:2-oxoglutarate dehydrogenase E1 component